MICRGEGSLSASLPLNLGSQEFAKKNPPLVKEQYSGGTGVELSFSDHWQRIPELKSQVMVNLRVEKFFFQPRKLCALPDLGARSATIPQFSEAHTQGCREGFPNKFSGRKLKPTPSGPF